MAKKRIEINVETTELLVGSRKVGFRRGWCAQCQAMVWFVSSEDSEYVVTAHPDELELLKEILMRRGKKVITGLLTMVALTFSCVACSSPEAGSSKTRSDTVASATPASSQSSSSASPISASTPTLPAASVIAQADGDMPNLHVQVHELKRTGGDTITLKFALLNDSEKPFGLESKFGEEGKQVNVDWESIGGSHLIDVANKKKYFVLRDTENYCLCSRGVPPIATKSRTSLWAKFPAPPADVEKITVVIPHFTPMDDVPISR